MGVVFFGLYQSFDLTHIGGVDATVRRLTDQLSQMHYEVEHVLYGAPSDSEVRHETAMVHYFVEFKDALKHIELRGKGAQVVSIYIRPKDRPRYALFRLSNREATFSHIYFTFPESRLKRKLMMLDSWLAPFSGAAFAVSPRLVKLIPYRKGHLLWPPVPPEYHRRKQDSYDGPLRLTFMGRIDPGKGTGKALQLFRELERLDVPFSASICGYPWKHRPETMALHFELMSQTSFKYEPREFEGFDPEVEQYVSDTLANTDVLVLPYVKLSSTIDTPMLLLEGIAHQCIVLTKPLGDMPDIVGSDSMMFEQFDDVERIAERLKELRRDLLQERNFMSGRAEKLKFDSKSVAENFLETLGMPVE